MSATKILWGQILVVFLIVLVTTWSATQWTAWQLGFQPQLGRPWFELLGWPIYYPPAFFWWWYLYDAHAFAFSLATTLMVAIVIFKAGDGTMSVMPASEYDGDASAIIREVDPFAP